MTPSLEAYWGALAPVSPLVCEFQQSRRFPELTYLREDLIGNYKGRKYQSLLPWMVGQGFKVVDIRGSSHSSNLVQLGLRLRALGIRPRYLLEGREGPALGNGLLARLLLAKDFSQKSFTEPSDWVVPEGGSCPQALPGSLGIAGSVAEVMRASNTVFQDVYIDSGTGFTAAALILGLGALKVDCRVRVVSMTGQAEADIWSLIDELHPEYKRIFEEQARPVSFEVHHPPVGKSFGSVPAAVFEEIESAAQLEGLLFDPLYTAKLSMSFQELREPGRSSCMFVSGGAKELLGFQGPLSKWLQGRS